MRDKVGYHLAWFARKISERGYQKQNADFTGYHANGDFVATGEDFFISRYAQFMEGQPHSNPFVFVDVGANSGHYTQLILTKLQSAKSRLNLRGELFEPQENTAIQNLLNQYADAPRISLTWNRTGAGSETGTMELYSVKGDEASVYASSQKESVLHFVNKQQIESCNMRVVRLDEYLSSNSIPVVDLLKIDTEGYELDVLQGAGSYLTPERIRVIQFEFNSMHYFRRQFLGDFVDILIDKGYELYRLSKHGFIPVTPYNPEIERFVFQNFVAFNPTLTPLNT